MGSDSRYFRALGGASRKCIGSWSWRTIAVRAWFPSIDSRWLRMKGEMARLFDRTSSRWEGWIQLIRLEGMYQVMICWEPESSQEMASSSILNPVGSGRHIPVLSEEKLRSVFRSPSAVTLDSLWLMLRLISWVVHWRLLEVATSVAINRQRARDWMTLWV